MRLNHPLIGQIRRAVAPLGTQNPRKPMLILAALAVPLLVLLTLWQAGPEDELLFGGRTFTESELASVQAAFAAAALNDYHVEPSTRQVRVPRAERALYIRALQDSQALPRDFYSYTEEALSHGNFFESSRQQQVRLKHAQQRDLAQAIRAIDGIENAVVHFDESETGGLHRQRIVTASVGVVCRRGSLEEETVETIRYLVSRSKAGLEAQNVAVIDLKSGRPYPMLAGQGGVQSPEGLRRSQERGMERQWQDKIRTVLKFIPQAQIVVTAQLPTPPTDHFAEAATDPAPQGESSPADPDGREAPQLAVWVGIPQTYVRALWQQRHGSRGGKPQGAELQQIVHEVKQNVAAAVTALRPPSAPPSSLSVTVTPFDTPHSELLPTQTLGHTAGSWLARHGWFLLFLTVVCGLFVVRELPSWRKRWQRAAASEPATIRVYSEQEQVPTATASHRDGSAGGDEAAQLRDQLASMVRQDPEYAARVLNDWISNAS